MEARIHLMAGNSLHSLQMVHCSNCIVTGECVLAHRHAWADRSLPLLYLTLREIRAMASP